MDDLLGDLFGVPRKMMADWISPGKYVSGAEVAAAGIAELVEFNMLHKLDLLSSPEFLTGSNGRLKAHRPVEQRHAN